jgi:hypothetical protein
MIWVWQRLKTADLVKHFWCWGSSNTSRIQFPKTNVCR